jgi:hypothetical protein
MGRDANEGKARADRGSGRANKRLAGWGAKRAHGDAGLLRDVPNVGSIIDGIVSHGDAVIIARTSDGGAVAITILSDDGRAKHYAAGQEELNEAFAALADAYDE